MEVQSDRDLVYYLTLYSSSGGAIGSGFLASCCGTLGATAPGRVFSAIIEAYLGWPGSCEAVPYVCTPFTIDNFTFGGADSDADGMCGDVDGCANSDLSLQIEIAGCETGVANIMFPDGCTLQDRISFCGVGVQNHGEFVRCASRVANDLREEGVLTGRQKGRIQRRAARSNPHPAPDVVRVVRERG